MKKQQIGKKEIVMIIVTITLMIILGLKSNLMDEVKDLTPSEQQFKDFVDYSIERDHDGLMDKEPLMVYRVYKIEMADENQKAVLRYQDPNTGEQVEVIQDGRLNAKVRGYVLGIFPINHYSITAEIQK